MGFLGRLADLGLKAPVIPGRTRTDSGLAWVSSDAAYRKHDPGLASGEEAVQRASLKLPAMFTAANNVAKAAAVHRPRIVRVTGPDEEAQEIKNHPFERVLWRPNDWMSDVFLFWFTFLSLPITGNAYWFISEYDDTGEPAEIWPVPPWRIRPVPSEDTETFIEYFEYKSDYNAKPFRFSPRQVCWFRVPNIRDLFAGQSLAEPLESTIKTSLAQRKYRQNFFGPMNARPTAIFTIKKPLNKAQFETIKREILDELQVMNRAAMVNRAGDLDVSLLGMSVDDLGIIQFEAADAKEILDVVGWSEAIGAANTTFASAWAAEDYVTKYSVWPLCSLLASDLSAQQIRPRYGLDIEAKYKDFRPARRAEDRADYTAYAQDRTVNENRQKRGLTPIETDDELLAQLADTPVRLIPAYVQMSGGAAASPAEEPPEEEPEVPEEVKADLAKWQRKALRRMSEAGTAAVEFVSDVIPEDVALEVKAGLILSPDEDAVKSVFEQAVKKNGPGPIVVNGIELELGMVKAFTVTDPAPVAAALIEAGLPPDTPMVWGGDSYQTAQFDVLSEVKAKKKKGPGRGWWGPPRGTHTPEAHRQALRGGGAAAGIDLDDIDPKRHAGEYSRRYDDETIEYLDRKAPEIQRRLERRLLGEGWEDKSLTDIQWDLRARGGIRRSERIMKADPDPQITSLSADVSDVIRQYKHAENDDMAKRAIKEAVAGYARRAAVDEFLSEISVDDDVIPVARGRRGKPPEFEDFGVGVVGIGAIGLRAEGKVDERAREFISRGDAALDHDSIYNYETFSYPVKRDQKDKIATYLSEETGVSYDQANDFIKSWAESSNDERWASLQTQEAASELFDVSMSDWQKRKVAETSADRHMRVTERYDAFESNPIGGYSKGLGVYEESTGSRHQFPYASGKDASKALLRSMYRRTQRELESAGYAPDDTIRLYRGVSQSAVGGLKERMIEVDDTPTGKVVAYRSNALESWSTNEDVAIEFADRSGGVVLAMDVPVRRVVGSSRTGFGCMNEWEIVVTGQSKDQEEPDEALVTFESQYFREDF